MMTLRKIGSWTTKATCAECGQRFEFEAHVDVESGPCSFDIEQFENATCPACAGQHDESELDLDADVAAERISLHLGRRLLAF